MRQSCVAFVLLQNDDYHVRKDAQFTIPPAYPDHTKRLNNRANFPMGNILQRVFIDPHHSNELMHSQIV